MSGTWYTRLSVILVVLLWGAWMLYPTVAGDSAKAMLEAQAEEV